MGLPFGSIDEKKLLFDLSISLIRAIDLILHNLLSFSISLLTLRYLWYLGLAASSNNTVGTLADNPSQLNLLLSLLKGERINFEISLVLDSLSLGIALCKLFFTFLPDTLPLGRCFFTDLLVL